MGKTVDDVIQATMNADIVVHSAFNKSHYDPNQRHLRYLRNRQLKGRAGGGNAAGGGGSGGGTSTSSGVHVNRTQLTQEASSARQVAQIKGRLNGLKAHLKELLAKQKASSSSDSKSSDTKSSKSGATKSPADNKPKTAKQKAAAKEALAKAQKERAKTQKAKPDKKPDLSLSEQIDKTRAVIKDVESKLATVIEQARTQTASNGR